MATLVEINDAVNRLIKGLLEPVGEDLWQTPQETIQLGTGDCEDLAILKYILARRAGYDAKVLAVQVAGYGAHVVCLIQSGKHKWILDNLATEIVELDARLGVDILKLISVSSEGMPHNDPRFDDMMARGVDHQIVGEFEKKAGL